ncbi:MAG: hypothetical protein SVN78_09440 [Deferribacterota bacterium]|nr:hypothetical protein [Deferribacterota bacterium]
MRKNIYIICLVSFILVVFLIEFAKSMANAAGTISAGKDYSLYVNENGEVFAWGNNYSGKLGDGTTTDRIYPVKLDSLSDKNIEKVLASCNNSFAIDKDNNLWAWGENLLNYLMVGVGDSEIDDCCQEYSGPSYYNESYTPTIVEEVKNIYDITSSCYHTLIITNNDELALYAWGEGFAGQLGINDRNMSYLYKPYKVYNPQSRNDFTIIDVSAGNSFSIALRSDGDAFTWGDNKYGQLGVDLVPIQMPPNELFLMPLRTLINNMINYTSEYSIIPLETDKAEEVEELQIVDISAGGDHALTLMEDGSLWAWGRNDKGQLGRGNVSKYSNIPMRVEFPDNTTIVQISAGQDHSLALDSDGSLWAWGDNSYGQIGIPNLDREYCTLPVKVKDLPKVKEISAGFFHNLVITEDNRIYGWGSNYYGQLARYQFETIIQAPTEIRLDEREQPSYILPRLNSVE